MQLEMEMVRTAGGQERKPIEATGGPGLASGGQDLLLTEASGGQGLLLAGGKGLLLAEAAGECAISSGWLSKCSTKHLFVCSLSKLAVLRKHKQNSNTLQHYTVEYPGQQNIV